ncbi:hypothetical protein [Streptomyces sp. NPDC051211]|uniref:hypothetical protein n=1 Tax=Streptomyces sp. NPDC051211 TaxID=3154643 RepID=UPI00344E25C1
MAIEVNEFAGLGSVSRAARMISGVATVGRPPTYRGRGRVQAFAGSGDDEFEDELGGSGDDVKNEPAVGGGGVRALLQRGEADLAAPQLCDGSCEPSPHCRGTAALFCQR